jgi:uncharacterized lipoprotein YajG
MAFRLLLAVALILAAACSEDRNDEAAARACTAAADLNMDVLLLEVSVPSDEYDNRVQAIQEEAKASGDNEMIAAAAVLTTASDNAEADFLITRGYPRSLRGVGK